MNLTFDSGSLIPLLDHGNAQSQTPETKRVRHNGSRHVNTLKAWDPAGRLQRSASNELTLRTRLKLPAQLVKGARPTSAEFEVDCLCESRLMASLSISATHHLVHGRLALARCLRIIGMRTARKVELLSERLCAGHKPGLKFHVSNDDRYIHVRSLLSGRLPKS